MILFIAGCHAEDDATPASNATEAVAPVHAFRKGAETMQFQAEVNRLMDILINSLYSNKDIFLRELISNAADALDKIRFLALTDKSQLGDTEESQALGIRIWVDEERRVLSIRDSGVGMTRQDLVNNLGTVARSGTSAFLEQAQRGGDLSLIGQFGVGFYSVYLVADYVEVVTKHNNDSQWVWESRASGDYALSADEDGPQLGRGTQINIHLKPACEEYARPDKLRELVQRYSEFISFPISLQVEKTVTKEVPLDDDSPAPDSKDADDKDADVVDEDEEEAKEKTKTVTEKVKEWEVLNDAQALWLRAPGDVTDEDYDKFFQVLSKGQSNPLAHTHFRAEGDVEFKAILYVPRTPPPDMYQDYYSRKPSLKLYVRRVFISDTFEDLLPKWLSFLVGLVDSDSMPLNVSREMLQLHEGLKVIKKKLVRKALDMIRRLSDDERSAVKELAELGPAPEDEGEAAAARRAELTAARDKYPAFWKAFHKAVKMGVIEEKAHRKRMLPLLRFPTSSSNGSDTTLDEYLARMKEGQKHIYYHIGMSKEEVEKSPFVETLVARGYEVVYLSDPLDEYMMGHLNEYDGHDFVNVAKDDLRLPEDADAKEAEKKEEFKPLTRWWKKLLVLGQPVERVRISQRLTSRPCVVMANKFGWSAQMERLSMTQALGADPSQAKWQRGLRTLEINPTHPLVRELKARVAAAPDAAETKNRAMVLYETCLMESGYLVEDVTGFNSRVLHLLGASLGLEDLVEPTPPKSKLDEPKAEKEEEDDDDGEPKTHTFTSTMKLGVDDLKGPITIPVGTQDEVAAEGEATNMVQKGLNAPTLEQEIAAWSEVVDRYSLSNEPWAAEVAGRALGNRGNARARQGDMEGALADLDAAADKCPWAVDPVLKRGVVLEALGRWDDAIADFTEVLAVAPRDPAAWNNMGNAHAGAGRYAEALAYYDGAVQLAPAFSFAAANKALALYQLEQDELSLHEMRSLLRRYPSFVDVRAALTAALWRAGQEAEAEDQWLRVDDPRYRERDWLVTKRRWPPRLVGDLLAFLSLQSTVVPAA
ncbi:Endoplasmin-like protein [Auxenochlorella protothecoides]|uniref:Endoplasmin-like protein n=1 Tax=Auxenochlorella protothecoides TaxID=3075 RepID=A0A087STY9_AUXPR|nr:Endoplasmin-like protein [Auxenochlorella protothecoides]KFM29193.1 Endoplasmin-like protein [Auxenochlorella protothecoides]